MEDWQDSVWDYALHLDEVAARYPNYSGVSLHQETHTIIAQGTGSAPPEVASVIAAAPENASVRWVAVPYTEAELKAEADALFEQQWVTYTAVRPGCDGITVGVLDGAPDRASIMRDTDGIPVFLDEVNELPQAGAGRVGDGGD